MSLYSEKQNTGQELNKSLTNFTMKFFLRNTHKVIRSLFFLYAFQLLLSSCIIDDCNCRPTKTYEISNTDLELQVYDTSGFNFSEINGTVSKNTFGIRLNLIYSFEQIASINSKNSFSNLGFSSANACSCVNEFEFIYLNTIESIKIMVTDTVNQNTQDVTEDFEAFLFGEALDLTDLSNLQNESDSYPNRFENIELELNKTNSIPNSAIFTFEIVLSSGNKLTKQTEIINFE